MNAVTLFSVVVVVVAFSSLVQKNVDVLAIVKTD